MANKKVRDILPPAAFREDGLSQAAQIKASKEKKAAGRKKGLFFFLPLFLILLGVFCYFVLPYLWGRIEIEIWPETEDFALETKLTLAENITQIFQKEKALADIFQSSGSILKEKRAEGVIRAYNEYSVSPQVLVATTRFVSADGKVFRTSAKVTIPGGRYEKGKFVSGEIDIKVVADESGPEYNIGPTTFSIPGFAGTDRYLKFYGKSFEPMKDGFREEVPRVTKEDLNRAEEVLTKQAREECQELLKSELRVKEGFDYFLKDIRTEIFEKFSLTVPEEEVKEFKFQVKVKCETLLFEKEYLNSYAKKLIIEQISEEKELVEESLKIDYFSESVDLDSGQIILSLRILAKTYSEIDLYNLKNALAGKSLAETNLLLENQPKVLKVNVNFWPFWVKRVPENLDKINLSLRFDSALF